MWGATAGRACRRAAPAPHCPAGSVVPATSPGARARSGVAVRTVGLDTVSRISDIQTMRISEQVATAKVGRRGTVVLPARLRRKYALEEGSLVIVEERPEGLMLRPAATYPIEMYTPARVAEFLLNNAVDEGDYTRAIKEVRRLGVDPKSVPHRKP